MAEKKNAVTNSAPAKRSQRRAKFNLTINEPVRNRTIGRNTTRKPIAPRRLLPVSAINPDGGATMDTTTSNAVKAKAKNTTVLNLPGGCFFRVRFLAT
jgi:hypothetical protein